MDRPGVRLAADHGGQRNADEVAASMQAREQGSRDGAAGDRRSAFLRMPYWRDETTRRGAILDTFESAVTWGDFGAFYAGVRHDVADSIERITGMRSTVSCRFTHVCPDGMAPYFSFLARGSNEGDIASARAQWREIKRACSEAVVGHGGTSTHHHAVYRALLKDLGPTYPQIW